MKILKAIRRYYFYCGIEKEEYNELKKDAYGSNFEVWRIWHFIFRIRERLAGGPASYISFYVVSVPVWVLDKHE
ncbi:MAG: hypothetical protein K6F55_07695 [Eubacterium sp.]|nr:hypothetical protein [Eubacterium sp.]